MIKKLTYLLANADLKPEEIKIYLLLLKSQKATITELVDKSKLNTMMVYRTIKKLHERGLIEPDSLNNKQKIYKPLSLQSLIKKLNVEQKKLYRLEQSLKGLDSFLPYIDMEDENSEELIEVKEGIDAFREEYLKMPELCSHEYMHIGSMENYWKVAEMSDDCPEERGFRRKRMNRGIYARVIDVRSKGIEEIQKRDSLEMRTMKMREDLPIMNNYLAMGENHSTLFICDAENPRAIVMKQKELLEMQKLQFKSLWV